MTEDQDDLDDFIAEEAKRNPQFPEMVQAAVVRQEILHRLAKARQKRGLSQAAVARRMGTSAAAVARLEAGSNEVLLTSAIRYAQAAGLELDIRIRKVPNH